MRGLSETPYAEGKVFWVMSCKHVLCNDEKHRREHLFHTLPATGLLTHMISSLLTAHLQH